MPRACVKWLFSCHTGEVIARQASDARYPAKHSLVKVGDLNQNLNHDGMAGCVTTETLQGT